MGLFNKQQSDQNQQTDSFQYDYENYRDPSALQLRLSCQDSYDRFQLYLRGKTVKEVSDPESPTKTVRRVIKTGEPLCNEDGVREIMGMFEGVVNTNNVQGNWKEGAYYDYLQRLHRRFALALSVNGKKWACREHRKSIISKFILQVIPFLTRPIDNLERDSYENIKHIESSNLRSPNENKGLFS